MTPVLWSILSAAAAVALVVPVSSGRTFRILRTGSGEERYGAASLQRIARTISSQPLWSGAAAALVAGWAGGPVAAAAAGGGAALLSRALARRRDSSTRDAQLAALARVLAGFAADLRAGRAPLEALAAMASSSPPGLAQPLRAAAQAATLGADPAGALLRYAGQVPAIDRLAACWRVSTRTGAGLADIVDALAEDLRLTVQRQRSIAVEVAAAVATARLLAGLPAVGLLLGASIGADPLHFLLHTLPGASVLAGGLLLDGLGLLWTHRLVAGVANRP